MTPRIPHAMADYTIENMDQDCLAEAWPVARMSPAHLDCAWWRTEGEELIGRGGGVLAARAPDGAIHGIATYKPVDRPRIGRVLSVERLITFELSRRAPCRTALCEALDLLATILACNHVMLPLTCREGTPSRTGRRRFFRQH